MLFMWEEFYMQKAWVYNFDGTIYNGNSSIDFLKFCIKKNKKVLLYLPKIFIFTILFFLKIINIKKYEEKFFSFLKLFSNVNILTDEFWQHNNKINNFFLEDISIQNIKIYVVSNSPEFLLNSYLKQFSNVYLIAPKYNLSTYKIEGVDCWEKEKTRRLFNNNKITIEKFYSNSFGDVSLTQKAKSVYFVNNGKLELCNEKKIDNIRNRKSAFVIFLLFFVFYLILGVFLSYHYDFKSNNNLLFDSDTSRVINDFSNILGNHYRIKVHPLYVLFVQPFIFLLNSITMDSMLSLIIFSSAVSALSVMILYLISSHFICNQKIKIVLCLMFGFAFTNIIYSSGIEVYNVATLFLLLLWYHTINIFKAERVDKKDYLILILLGITSIAFTITNYFIFLIISLILLLSKKINFSKLFAINIIVVMLVIGLSCFQNMVWGNTELIYRFDNNFQEEKDYINYNVTFDKVKEVLKNGYINSLISSDVIVENHGSEGNIISFGQTSIISIVVFCVFAGVIFYFLIRNFRKNLFLNIGIILALCFNVCLHLVYGGYSFLYSCHFLYLVFLLFIINYCDLKNLKNKNLVFNVFVLITLLEIVINFLHFKNVLAIVRNFLTPNYFRANFNTLILFLLVMLVILISLVLIYLIYKNIRRLRSEHLFYPIFNSVVCFILLQCLFIAILTAPHYGRFLGVNIGNISYEVEPSNVKNATLDDLKLYFKDEYKSYLSYLSEFQDFSQNYSVELVDIGENDYYLFGMGNRKKILFKDGNLIDLDSKKTLYELSVKNYLIVPNEYTVLLSTTQGDYIKIYENEDGIFIQKNEKNVNIEGTDYYIDLESFKGQKYKNIKKVLYNEILFNIKDSIPYPNIFVYDSVWYRDGAMVAMALEQTNNVDLIERWISSIDKIYDLQNDNNKEPDNLGELLYICSVSSNSHDELISKIISEAEKIKKEDTNGNYLYGLTDGNYHSIYQNKWYNFGLSSLNIDNKFNYKKEKDSYDALTWWYGKDSNTYYESNLNESYPYLSLAQYHKTGKGVIYLNKHLYPLSYEKNGSEADYENMYIIDKYYTDNKISPTHTWAASEFLLFLLDETGDLK